MSKRYIKYKSTYNIYHINFEGKISTKTNINVSTYIPPIIRTLVNSLDNSLNSQYIICPFYSNYYDYQIGITETMKFGDNTISCMLRGINEEVGLYNIYIDKKNIIKSTHNNKQWNGTIIRDKVYTYKPNMIINTNSDIFNKKVAIIIYNNLNSLIYTFSNIKKTDLNSDNIIGIGLISVLDCKQILNIQTNY